MLSIQQKHLNIAIEAINKKFEFNRITLLTEIIDKTDICYLFVLNDDRMGYYNCVSGEITMDEIHGDSMSFLLEGAVSENLYPNPFGLGGK